MNAFVDCFFISVYIIEVFKFLNCISSSSVKKGQFVLVIFGLAKIIYAISLFLFYVEHDKSVVTSSKLFKNILGCNFSGELIFHQLREPIVEGL